MLIKQRTMLINTLRGLMAEFGIVVAEGPHHVGELAAILADPADQRIPPPLHEGLLAIVETLCGLERRIEIVDKPILDWGRSNQTCQHLITIPGYGPILSSAMAAMAVDPAAFGSGRHFSASFGLARGRTGREEIACPCEGGGQTGSDQQARQRLSAPTARQQPALGLDPMGRHVGAVQQVSPAGSLAGQIARDQGAQGRRLRARQQDGAHRLGGDDAPTSLSPATAGSAVPQPGWSLTPRIKSVG